MKRAKSKQTSCCREQNVDLCSSGKASRNNITAGKNVQGSRTERALASEGCLPRAHAALSPPDCSHLPLPPPRSPEPAGNQHDGFSACSRHSPWITLHSALRRFTQAFVTDTCRIELLKTGVFINEKFKSCKNNIMNHYSFLMGFFLGQTYPRHFQT